MATYGFIGLGIMGSGMAANLVRAGFDVTVWNRTPHKTEALAAMGASVAGSPSEVAASCEITFAMLSDPASVREVLFGADGVLEGVGAGHDLVDMSTVDDATSRETAAAVHERGGHFVEAPVSGTKKPAEDGTLVILAAGDRDLYDAAQPAFDAMGKIAFYLGETGNGSRMKLAVNAVMGGMMAAFAEGVALAEKAGLPGETVLEVLDQGAMACPMFRAKGPMLLQRDYPASFPLKHMRKDLRLAQELAREVGQPLSTTDAATGTFERAMTEGRGDEDISAVFEAIR